MKSTSIKKILIAEILLICVAIALISVIFQKKALFSQADAAVHIDRTIQIVSSNTEGYAPDVINIKYGETVKLELTTADTAHSFTMSGYNINQMIYPGKQTEIIFHATKRGTFTFFCVVPCPMIKNGGTIIVF